MVEFEQIYNLQPKIMKIYNFYRSSKKSFIKSTLFKVSYLQSTSFIAQKVHLHSTIIWPIWSTMKIMVKSTIYIKDSPPPLIQGCCCINTVKQSSLHLFSLYFHKLQVCLSLLQLNSSPAGNIHQVLKLVKTNNPEGDTRFCKKVN